MNTQIQFFMTREDSEEFMNVFKDSDYDTFRESGFPDADYPVQVFYCCGEEKIQLSFSEQFDKIITIGRVAIKTKNIDDNSKRCDKLYRKMRKWIKDNYMSDLLHFNPKKRKREDAIPVAGGAVYLSPRGVKLVENNQTILKFGKNTYGEYILAMPHS